jgi:hypothetical protein
VSLDNRSNPVATETQTSGATATSGDTMAAAASVTRTTAQGSTTLAASSTDGRSATSARLAIDGRVEPPMSAARQSGPDAGAILGAIAPSDAALDTLLPPVTLRRLQSIRSGYHLVLRSAAPFAAIASALLLLVVLAGYGRLRLYERTLQANSRLRRLGRVRVYVSDRATVPFSCGIVVPRIYVRSDSFSRDTRQGRAVLTHELTHVRSGDLVWNAVELVLRVLLWFSPAVHLLARRGRVIREMRADRAAVDDRRRDLYVRTLLHYANLGANHRLAAPALALPMVPARRAERRKSLIGRVRLATSPLLRRVRRLVSHNPGRVPAARIAAGVVVAVITTAMILGCAVAPPVPDYLGMSLKRYDVIRTDSRGRITSATVYDGSTHEIRETVETEPYVGGGTWDRLLVSVRSADGLLRRTYTMPDRSRLALRRRFLPISMQGGTSADAYYDMPSLVVHLFDDAYRPVRTYTVDYDLIDNTAPTTQPIALSGSRGIQLFSYRPDGTAGSIAVGRPWHGRPILVVDLDEAEKPVRATLPGTAGSPDSEIAYEYDEQDRLVRATETAGGEVVSTLVTDYRRDGSRVVAWYGTPGFLQEYSGLPNTGINHPYVLGPFSGNAYQMTVFVDGWASGVYFAAAPFGNDQLSEWDHRTLGRIVAEEVLHQLADLPELYADLDSSRLTDDPQAEPLEGSVRLALSFGGGASGVNVIPMADTPLPALDSFVDDVAAERINSSPLIRSVLSRPEVDETMYYLMLRFDFSTDAETGEHLVGYPNLMMFGTYGTFVSTGREMAYVSSLLRAAPDKLIQPGCGETAVVLGVLPDGTIVDPQIVWTDPHPPTPDHERSLIHELYGDTLMPTGQEAEVDLLLVLRRKADPIVEGPDMVEAVLVSEDPRLSGWLADLQAANYARESHGR